MMVRIIEDERLERALFTGSDPDAQRCRERHLNRAADGFEPATVPVRARVFMTMLLTMLRDASANGPAAPYVLHTAHNFRSECGLLLSRRSVGWQAHGSGESLFTPWIGAFAHV